VADNDGERVEGRQARMTWGAALGYAGFLFGLLAVVSAASEVEPLAPGPAAGTVLLSMVVGYLSGYFLQPVLSRFFSGPSGS
jgi:hypothetical protein